jgi:pyruvate dehydrogenase E2 component (dihydrolipoamide acetyltransferase)
MPTIVKMPKWGLTMTAGIVVDWLSAEGAEVSEGDPLLTVETEKAVDDVPAPAGGILYRIVAAAGSEVPVSAPVAVIVAADETVTDEDLATLVREASPAAATAEAGGAAAGRTREARAATRDRGGRINASPAARKLAAELGVDLETVDATGPGGRITSEDVERAAAESGEPAVEERDLALADDRTIHALFAGPRKAQTLVFVHGLGGSLSTWQIVLGGLADEWRLIAIDLPGHGQSAKTAGADYSIAGHAAAVAEALEGAGVRDAIVVGHSLGGAVALRLASEQPGPVRGLALIDSAGLGEEVGADLLASMAGEPGPETARALLELFMADQKLVSPRAVEEMAGNQTAEGGWTAQQATANAAFASGQQSGIDREALRSVTQPALVIWGERDRVIPVDHAYAAARTLPDAVVAVLPGIGHVPQVEAPERVTTLIRRFARSLG